MSEKQVKTTFYVGEDKLDQLRKLSDHTRISQAVYFREAIDDLLAKYRNHLLEISKKRK